MAAKQKTADRLSVEREATEPMENALARTALRPVVTAAVTLQRFNATAFPDLPLNAIIESLSAQCKAASAGNLGRAEAMLTAQAHTLDAIFNTLARRAAMNVGEHLHATDTYMRLALKAQSQCRTTLEALAEIKNPAPVAFVRQANIGNAVQVNNGDLRRHTPARAHAEESAISQNKLLEHQHGERLDFGTPAATVPADPTMATVGTLDGAVQR